MASTIETEPVEVSRHPAAPRHCRMCSGHDLSSFVDLGKSPLCESYLSADQLSGPEAFYPLHAFVCNDCLLVQLDEFVSGREIFDTDYAYYSSYSTSWVAHAGRLVEQMQERLGLNESSRVVEVASNDGYLLQHVVKRGIPCLGIEPAGRCAEAAREKGVDSHVGYLDAGLGEELRAAGVQAQWLVANNVLAHVPDLHDFVSGLKSLLAAEGTMTIEVPHLLCLIQENQFDTIYHEHFCYFTLRVLIRLFERHELCVTDVERLASHGGSLRVYVMHRSAAGEPSRRVAEVLGMERRAGLASPEGYVGFQDQVNETKWRLLEFLIDSRRQGKRIVGYGAPGKGNTLLNYCGIRQDLIDFVVDRNPYKQGKFLPGTHLPIHAPEKLIEARPDEVLIMPWNLKDEIATQLAEELTWPVGLSVPIPYWQRVELPGR